jgi:hypothetical protein
MTTIPRFRPTITPEPELEPLEQPKAKKHRKAKPAWHFICLPTVVLKTSPIPLRHRNDKPETGLMIAEFVVAMACAALARDQHINEAKHQYALRQSKKQAPMQRKRKQDVRAWMGHSYEQARKTFPWPDVAALELARFV